MPRANPDVNYEISIHALLAESDRSLLLPVRGSRISIHALLAESDPRIGCEKAGNQNFYPRSPCGERQYIPFTALMASAYFYPRSPCGERRTPNLYTTKCTDISIHALLAESDGASFVMSLFYINFYPRSPCGERHFKKEILP